MSRVIHFGQNPDPPGLVRFGGRAVAAVGTVIDDDKVHPGTSGGGKPGAKPKGGFSGGALFLPLYNAATNAWEVHKLDGSTPSLIVSQSLDAELESLEVLTAIVPAADHLTLYGMGPDASDGFGRLISQVFDMATETWDATEPALRRCYTQLNAMIAPWSIDAGAVDSFGFNSVIHHGTASGGTTPTLIGHGFVKNGGTTQFSPTLSGDGGEHVAVAISGFAMTYLYRHPEHTTPGLYFHRHRIGQASPDARTFTGYDGTPGAGCAIDNNRTLLTALNASGKLVVVVAPASTDPSTTYASTIDVDGLLTDKANISPVYDAAGGVVHLAYVAGGTYRRVTWDVTTNAFGTPVVVSNQEPASAWMHLDGTDLWHVLVRSNGTVRVLVEDLS